MDCGLRAWLGPAYGELSDGQREDFSEVVAAVGRVFPDADDTDARDAIMSATVQGMLGESDVDWRPFLRLPDLSDDLLAAVRREAAVSGQWGGGFADCVAAVLRWAGIEQAAEERNGR